MFEFMDLIDDRFRVQEELGRGGMGVVLRVLDRNSNEVVALKYCTMGDPETKRRFARGVRVMSSIQHRNVMPVLHHNVDYSPPYFTMPLANHSIQQELEGVLEEEETEAESDDDQALEVFKDICQGIQAIHSAGATHRDIKPANTMRMVDGSIVISDLGLAKLDPRDTTILTQTGVFMGTRLYSAPEQLIESRDADERTDVYQLGKVLYQSVTGDLPTLIDKAQLPSGLDHIVDRATRQHPNERYQSVGALMDAIESYLRAKSPDANRSQEYEAAIQEAQFLASNAEYRLENLKSLLTLVLWFTEDHYVFLEKFDRLPLNTLSVMAHRLPEEFAPVLSTYCTAIKDVVGGYSFEYAETVARNMRAVFDAGTTDLKVLAMKATMIGAVRLNRYAAMEVFDAMLVQITDPKDALPIADMLREEAYYYRELADRVSRTRLHPAILSVYDEVVE